MQLNLPIICVLYGSGPDPAKTRTRLFFTDRNPNPTFHHKPEQNPNPNVKPDKTRRVFEWLENWYFQTKTPILLQKTYLFTKNSTNIFFDTETKYIEPLNEIYFSKYWRKIVVNLKKKEKVWFFFQKCVFLI